MDADLADLKKMFKTYDLNGDGKVSFEEFSQLMRSMGYNLSLMEQQQMFAAVDLDNSGDMTFDEYCQVINGQKQHDVTPDQVIDSFRIFDKNGKGFISAVDLRHVMTTIGEKMTDEEVDDMLREADVEGDGVIDYQQFARMLFAN